MHGQHDSIHLHVQRVGNGEVADPYFTWQIRGRGQVSRCQPPLAKLCRISCHPQAGLRQLANRLFRPLTIASSSTQTIYACLISLSHPAHQRTHSPTREAINASDLSEGHPRHFGPDHFRQVVSTGVSQRCLQWRTSPVISAALSVLHLFLSPVIRGHSKDLGQSSRRHIAT